MNQGKLFVLRPFVGLVLGLGVLAGCDGGGSDSGAEKTGPGYPGVRGPASPKMKRPGAAGKGGRAGAAAKAPRG